MPHRHSGQWRKGEKHVRFKELGLKKEEKGQGGGAQTFFSGLKQRNMGKSIGPKRSANGEKDTTGSRSGGLLANDPDQGEDTARGTKKKNWVSTRKVGDRLNQGLDANKHLTQW